MQNHTNAAVTIHQKIAEKFVGVTQKISTEYVVERDWVEKAGLERPCTPEDKVIFFPSCFLMYSPPTYLSDVHRLELSRSVMSPPQFPDPRKMKMNRKR